MDCSYTISRMDKTAHNGPGRRIELYRLVQDPCIIGDDVVLGVDNSGLAYVAFDGWMTAYKFDGDLQDWIAHNIRVSEGIAEPEAYHEITSFEFEE